MGRRRRSPPARVWPEFQRQLRAIPGTPPASRHSGIDFELREALLGTARQSEVGSRRRETPLGTARHFFFYEKAIEVKGRLTPFLWPGPQRRQGRR